MWRRSAGSLPESFTRQIGMPRLPFWNRLPGTKPEPLKIANKQSKKSTSLPSGIRSLARLRDEDDGELRDSREEMVRLRALGSNTSRGVPYTDEEINAMARKGKHAGDTFRCCEGQSFHRCENTMSQHLSSVAGSGGCGADEIADDLGRRLLEGRGGRRRLTIVSDVIYVEYDCKLGIFKSLGKVARERIPGELSPSNYPGRHVARDKYPQRHVARESVEMSLGIVIRYAIRHNVEDVDLCLFDVGVGQGITFEDELFLNTSCITRMTLSFCRFNPPNGAISWERLECLCLFFVTMDKDMIGKILSRSPCLESLELNDCHGYRRIDVTSKSVKKLVFFEYCCDDATDDDIDCIKINALYITSLTIKGELLLRELVLLNVSSLMEVDLKYSISYREFQIFAEEVFRGLLESLGHVKRITFWDRCSELLSRLKVADSLKLVIRPNSEALVL
ncbi:ribonuclease H-like domain-containing protein [Tanacetum coccineum]